MKKSENPDIKSIIEKFKLTPHPEGGYFREIYKSSKKAQIENRSYITHIYFLLPFNQNSYWHKLKNDEIWNFYEGGPLVIYTFDELTKKLDSYILGNTLKNENYLFSLVIPANIWFGAKVLVGEGYGFVGCSVGLGFEYEDFELAKKGELEEKYERLKGLLD